MSYKSPSQIIALTKISIFSFSQWINFRETAETDVKDYIEPAINFINMLDDQRAQSIAALYDNLFRIVPILSVDKDNMIATLNNLYTNI